jgi:hypothetical protein
VVYQNHISKGHALISLTPLGQSPGGPVFGLSGSYSNVSPAQHAAGTHMVNNHVVALPVRLTLVHMSRSNGRLEPEVIAEVCWPAFCSYRNSHLQFGDGYSFSKTKMASILRAMNDPVKSAKRAPACARADVDLIVSKVLICARVDDMLSFGLVQVEELEIPRSLAEQALIQNGGDVKAALQALIRP